MAVHGYVCDSLLGHSGNLMGLQVRADTFTHGIFGPFCWLVIIKSNSVFFSREYMFFSPFCLLKESHYGLLY
jgi:hypothetical protein